MEKEDIVYLIWVDIKMKETPVTQEDVEGWVNIVLDNVRPTLPSNLDAAIAFDWLKKHAKSYVKGEYNEFHHTVEYDGSIDVDEMVSDLECYLSEQKPAEWSEEDEMTRDALLNLVEMYYGCCFNKAEKNRLLDWLKSLRPQSHWKSTVEQMNGISTVLARYKMSPQLTKVIESLYFDLKKHYTKKT